MIEYVCPKCGSDLNCISLASNPPQYKYECTKCEWSHTEPQIKEEIIKVPYPISTNEEIININYNDTDPCKHCNNRPKNGEYKVCHCSLPSMRMISF